jgi:hypothetical protein
VCVPRVCRVVFAVVVFICVRCCSAVGFKGVFVCPSPAGRLVARWSLPLRRAATQDTAAPRHRECLLQGPTGRAQSAPPGPGARCRGALPRYAQKQKQGPVPAPCIPTRTHTDTHVIKAGTRIRCASWRSSAQVWWCTGSRWVMHGGAQHHQTWADDRQDAHLIRVPALLQRAVCVY